ncbi:transporter substrate-binding domain-containing protein [Roseobacter sp. A03A-229]
MRFASVALLLFSLSGALNAQEVNLDPLVVPFAEVPPFSFANPQGERDGFLIAMAEEIGSEIGVPIEYLDVSNSREFIDVQVKGQTQLIPGVLQLSPLAQTNLFSVAIAEDSLRPAVRADNQTLIDSGVLEGQSVGIVPPAVGSDAPILEQNKAVEFDSPQAALMELLTGRVDALLLPPPTVHRLARDAGVDGRIRFIGEPLMVASRHVALHQSRADLMPAINEAIARMDADGRLEELRKRYSIRLPLPPPQTLTIGINHAPPYGVIEADGEFSGFTVDVWRAIAQLANLSIEFQAVPGDVYSAGPSSSTEIDAAGLLLISEERAERMDFTLPLQEIDYQLFFRADNPPEDNVNPLAGRSIGVLPQSLNDENRRLLRESQVVSAASIDTLVDGLIDGTYDKILTLPEAARELFREKGVTDDIRVADGIVISSQLAPALRQGLGAVQERLNAVIPGFVLSDEYAALQQKYFAAPVFWTRARIIWSLIVTGGSLLLLVGIVISLNVRTRLRAAATLTSVRRELETIFNAATSGIVALSADGQILRINNRARHFLGGISGEPPLAWPEDIRFLEAETLNPLDNSADPIQRALSGHGLNKQTHLLRRSNSEEDRRYVRVDNASLADPESGIHTVLVIDDVSEEERNRQVIERRTRLDALGQLTGGIAHDFNNLLASQLYSISLARKSKDSRKREKYLEVTENSISRGRSLTNRLLAFARKQPGLSSARKTNEVLNDFELLIRPMLEEKIALTFQLEDPQLRHFCDQTQLETALMNLVLNSRDAILRSGRGSRIEVSARPVRAPDADLDMRQSGSDLEKPAVDGKSFRYVEFIVTDNGPGMDDETLARCTDPFFTTKGSNSGTGLGLAMVYGFVRQSYGDLRIYSEIGVGTTVRMTLPRGAEDGLREARVPEITPKRGGGQSILVVEDEVQLLAMLGETLEDLGYQVTTASSGKTALEMVEKGQQFALLLTDVVMPGEIGGFELARRIRQVDSQMPVIYMSGYTGFTASEMGDVQAPLLQKPTPPAELAEAIEVAIRDL